MKVKYNVFRLIPNQAYEGYEIVPYVFYPVVMNGEPMLISCVTREEAEMYIEDLIGKEVYPLVIMETYER